MNVTEASSTDEIAALHRLCPPLDDRTHSDVDLKQLRALLAVSEHRSFSAAARALHTEQSNISTHVSRLEREMGVTLIDRATNELTEEGQVVAERARRIEAEFTALDSDIASLRDEVRGRVRLGVIGTTARWLVPRLLEALDQHHPQVKVVVLDATTSSLVPQLVAGLIDLAVVNMPVNDPELMVEPLFDEDRILVAPTSHPLAKQDRVTLADLAQHELLLEAKGTSFREELDAEAADQGVELLAKAEFLKSGLESSEKIANFMCPLQVAMLEFDYI